MIALLVKPNYSNTERIIRDAQEATRTKGLQLLIRDGSPRGNSTSRRSPPNEAAPPGPRRLDVEPHLLFERLQVDLHEIGETALQHEIRHPAPRARTWIFPDSPLEEAGFEPSVPPRNDIAFERRDNSAFQLYLGQSTTRFRYMTRWPWRDARLHGQFAACPLPERLGYCW